MAKPVVIPLVDLFAGPGGLAEGFTSLTESDLAFEVAVAVEKEATAHQTLTLRSFFRQFTPGTAPAEYYAYLRGELTREMLFQAYPRESEVAVSSCLHAELGKAEDTQRIFGAIASRLSNLPLWVLIGGPPCQAYSVVGRSRMSSERSLTSPAGRIRREAFEADHRHYLYRHYLEIIARFRPPIFVVENVKGLLSSQVKGDFIFEKMLSDLQMPTVALGGSSRAGVRYRVMPFDMSGNEGTEFRQRDFIVHAEDHAVPQRRHRVILLGVRCDVDVSRCFELESVPPSPTVLEVLDDLPRLRSRLSREEDSRESWLNVVRDAKRQLFEQCSDSAVRKYINLAVQAAVEHTQTGGRFVPGLRRRSMLNDLREWYVDERLYGACNHETRFHRRDDLSRYLFVSAFGLARGESPKLADFPVSLLPAHKNAWKARKSGELFDDRFRVQVGHLPATTVTAHIAKDGHAFIHHDPSQCRSWTVREAARVQSFPDNYFFEGTRTQQYVQVGNAVPPLLARSIARRVANIIKDAFLNS